ncbi:TOPRIM nucleotidyl transferase/hydrolase domain-containing protein [Actinacidiphila sp. DG2A-62]|uniref:TOPRIM nucleotidyl transferase/hydrolase domain-containing protein n=1 Tax=Actinacidiphila sp. DG2A-62 TaxID=3108821 RepID=UPI003FA35B3D
MRDFRAAVTAWAAGRPDDPMPSSAGPAPTDGSGDPGGRPASASTSAPAPASTSASTSASRARHAHHTRPSHEACEAAVRDLAARLRVRVVVLLEGPSDAAAVDALAARRGRDLAAEGVCVLPIGGAMSVGRYARLLGPAGAGLGLRLTGLCDERERGYYARALTHAGAPRRGADALDSPAAPEAEAEPYAQPATNADARAQDFFVCSADLEDELIRALGPVRVTELVRAEGDMRALEIFLRQPAQRDRTPQQQLRRFLGTKKGRKIHYGRVLVEALAPDRVPAPLDDLFAAL